MIGEMRKCLVCGFSKELNKLNFNYYRRFGELRYRHICRDCVNAYKRTWRESRPIKEYWMMKEKNIALYGTSYSPQQHLYNNIRLADRRRKLKAQTIAMYGGKCECCSESDHNRLTLHHIYGDGRKDIITDYNKPIKAGYPNDKYQLLCWNCNSSYGFYGYCPHKKPAIELPMSQSSLYNRKLKNEVIVAYGGKCVLCGENQLEFMTIDHTNGGGCRIRRKQGGLSGTILHRYLKKHGYPKDGYRLLCFSCNSSIGLRKREVAI